MSVLGINHVQIGFPAGQHAQVQHSYGELLGLTQWQSGGGNTLRFFAGANTRVDLVPVSDPWQAPTEPAHLAFEVQNLPELRARLLANGLSLDESRPLTGHLRFYVHDPAGNALEFLEPDSSKVQAP